MRNMKQSIKILCWISLVMMIFSLQMTSAATRGVRGVIVEDSSGNRIRLYKQSHALVIGVSNYQDTGWQDLESVKADLEGALLLRARLDEAILWGANMKHTHLSGADFWGADVKGVDFEGANLGDARWEDANNLSAKNRKLALRGRMLKVSSIWRRPTD